MAAMAACIVSIRWRREVFSLSVAVQALCWGLAQPLAGAVADGFGPVRVLAVGALARVSGMGLSSFHEHFRAVTGTTPLRYQKELRLIEAKRLLTGGGHSVTAAGLAVGYESVAQFSREAAAALAEAADGLRADASPAEVD